MSAPLHESLRDLQPIVALKDRVDFLSVFEGLSSRASAIASAKNLVIEVVSTDAAGTVYFVKL